MLNRVTIMGRLVRDPEMRHTGNNIPVVSFTLAVDRDKKNSDGERVADFIDCEAWRGSAEFVSKYFRKGSMAVVSGRLQSHKWKDKDGNKRINWSVNVESVYFGDSKKSDDRNSIESASYSSKFSEISDEDGDIPPEFSIHSDEDGDFPF